MNNGAVEVFLNSGYLDLPVLRRWRIKFFPPLEANPSTESAVHDTSNSIKGFVASEEPTLINEINSLIRFISKEAPKSTLYYSKPPKNDAQSVTLYLVNKVIGEEYCVVAKITLTEMLKNIHYESDFKFALITFNVKLKIALLALKLIIIWVTLNVFNIGISSNFNSFFWFFILIFFVFDLLIAFRKCIGRIFSLNILFPKKLPVSYCIFSGIIVYLTVYMFLQPDNSLDFARFALMTILFLFLPVNYPARDRLSQIELDIIKEGIKAYFSGRF